MDKQQAQTIIKETFEKSFNRDRFNGFIKNLLNEIEDAPFSYQGNYIPDAYKPFISRYERIGKYNDGEKRIDILIVYLNRKTSIERARTSQRNFIAGYLDGKYGSDVSKDAALVAFVSPNEEDWRFSLVKMDYRFEQAKNGKVKVKEEFTPARRWSFLVGKNESSHTAQSRLVPRLADDEHNPTLTQMEEAFNIEKVTKEFFEEYRQLFLWVKETLDKIVEQNDKIKADFEKKDVNTVDFAKKLLGQVVFLYFLQKKGWFGVKRAERWDSGSKHFLRDLFEKKHSDYKNFFNNILEPLFYEALRQDRSHDKNYYSRFDCRIPFLNGGLFDPINDYDWVDTDIELPSELFSNQNKTKQADIGNGILDIFDRYNFTVKEDEPLEKEVAIDPELLGKAYEKFNAIRPDNFEEYKKALKSGKKGEETKFNKQHGVYYTPREIVYYMCQQSLINYLYTELNKGVAVYQDIGDIQTNAFGNETKVSQLDLTVKHKSGPQIAKEDIETLIKYGEQVGENEVTVEARGKETDTYFYKLPENIRKYAKLIDQKLANIKVCDPAIGSGAFPVGMMHEIVKTRNLLTPFLSLRGSQATKQSHTGDRFTNARDDNRTIYNFKRECIEKSLYGVDIDPGAVEIAKLRLWLSLVVDEEDIKQIKPLPNLDYKIVCGNSLLGVEKNLFNNQLFTELERLKPLLFNETNPTRKQDYKQRIDELISQITNGHKEFDFEVYFSEVFHEKKGFDVVIANPPYGIVFEKELKSRYGKAYITFKRNNDIFVAFYEMSVALLSGKSYLTFITPNTFLNGDYYKQLRRFFTEKTVIREILDFKDAKIFQDPTVFVCIFSISKKYFTNYPYRVPIRLSNEDFSNMTTKEFTIKDASGEPFKTTDPIMDRVLSSENISLLDSLFYVKDVGFNYWSIGKGKKRDGNSIGNRILYSGAQKNKKDKPFLKGKDISKYYYSKPTHYLRNDFKNYLEDGIDVFRYSAGFLKVIPKIVYRQTANRIISTIDYEGSLCDKSVHIIVPRENGINIHLKYLLALLNSHLFYYLYEYTSQETKGRAFAQVKTVYIKKLPIGIIGNEQQQPFITVVDRILAITQDEDYLQNPQKQAKVKTLEQEIDQMVYQLYSLTEEEIRIVEGEVK